MRTKTHTPENPPMLLAYLFEDPQGRLRTRALLYCWTTISLLVLILTVALELR